jgi:hypothetical protein
MTDRRLARVPPAPWTERDVPALAASGASVVLAVRGYPTRVRSSTASKDTVTSARLWERAEALTGATFG